MAHHLAEAIGSDGLIGGQALDLESDAPTPDLERLEYIHSHKTGALFLAAAELGAMAADAKRRDLEVVTRYAKNLGLAFQITDDLLDVGGDHAEVGKDLGKDDEEGDLRQAAGRRRRERSPASCSPSPNRRWSRWGRRRNRCGRWRGM